ncbi:response regulator [Leptolyngbya sp. FACHB-541]|uniref:response regulator n=1 Tax=Leptolyngbya sp. FACHB-541 TaxID=2692810 RepID=UPI0016861329|nr:response regulator [Leptolyngbya sp. FACHB-541]MBD1865711.1 response regulator [Cyanobacteria bacterium FACHB-471]MBD1999244.1 response regulator [Leptolyngbya sp. FACHB-541]
MPRSSSLSLDGLKVLVVDDDNDNLELFALLFETYGAVVTAASSAHDGFQAFLEQQPDILISDIRMPKQDGHMLLGQIRALTNQQGGQVPAIALTANARKIDQQKALAAGFQQHLAKPVDQDMLLQAVLELTSNKVQHLS